MWVFRYYINYFLGKVYGYIFFFIFIEIRGKGGKINDVCYLNEVKFKVGCEVSYF